MKYSEKELVTKLRTLADDLGRAPTSRELNAREDMPSQHAYSYRFGSWGNALNKAGLLVHKSNNQPHKTDEELLEMLQDLADDLGRPPRSREVNAHDELPTTGIFKSRFDSWTNALTEAGLQPDPVQQHHTDDELIGMLLDLADDLERVPTARELNKREHLPSSSLYQNRFGSWTVSLEYAGLTPQYRSGPPLAELVKELRSLCASFEQTPNRSVIEAHAPGALETYEQRFGSWQSAVQAVGFGHAEQEGSF